MSLRHVSRLLADYLSALALLAHSPPSSPARAWNSADVAAARASSTTIAPKPDAAEGRRRQTQ